MLVLPFDLMPGSSVDLADSGVFRRQMEDVLVDRSFDEALRQEAKLYSCGRPRELRLLPLSTRGDGSCLLHATSLFVTGLHDREGDYRLDRPRLLASSSLACLPACLPALHALHALPAHLAVATG